MAKKNDPLEAAKMSATEKRGIEVASKPKRPLSKPKPAPAPARSAKPAASSTKPRIDPRRGPAGQKVPEKAPDEISKELNAAAAREACTPIPGVPDSPSGKWRVGEELRISWFGAITTLSTGAIVSIDGYGHHGIQRIAEQGAKLEPIL